MANQLSDQEIKRRLQQLRNVTSLHAKARQRVESLETIVAEQAKLLAAKDQYIAQLQQQLVDKEAQRQALASYLYKAGQKTKAKLPMGKRPGSPAYHRPAPKPETVTERIIFSLKRCPACRGPVGKAVDSVDKYEEDIDLAPRKIVKHYTISRHWCPECEMFVRAKAPLTSRIGPNVLGYVLYARYRLRLPINKIRESLADLHDFAISEGEIVAQLAEAEVLFGADHATICELIKTASIVYADETGWRMDGANWQLWVFVTDKGLRYVIEQSRGGGVAKSVLGRKKDRVIVSDGYAVYAGLPGDNQQCWVHLLRAAKAACQPLYRDLVDLYQQLGRELTKSASQRDPPYFEQALQDLQTKHYHEPLTQKVQNRIAKHASSLLTCLAYEGVLPENNTAERAIRPQVVMRKIFSGNRSPKGAQTHAVNTSVIATKLKQQPELSFFEVMLPLIHQRRSEL